MDKKKHWLNQIDKLLGNFHFNWAHSTLQDIKQTIENTDRITDGQIQAIKNIKWGRND